MMTDVKGKPVKRIGNPHGSFTDELCLMTNKIIGLRLRSIRETHNSKYRDNKVSQEALSRDIGVTFGTVNRMENGKSGMQMSTLLNIASFWGMDIEDMLADLLIPTSKEVLNAARIKRILEDNDK